MSEPTGPDRPTDAPSDKAFVAEILRLNGWAFHESGSAWIGVSAVLNLNAAGDTMEDCIQCALEATYLLLGDLQEESVDPFIPTRIIDRVVDALIEWVEQRYVPKNAAKVVAIIRRFGGTPDEPPLIPKEPWRGN